ncbi:hypothetical protein [Streptomyces sp. NPDC050560]|uniref:hypothetical protein n=1 Tax=Streptomyces sp. NPDC050560 TaxID=3365630 RepID=UPI003792010A
MGANRGQAGGADVLTDPRAVRRIYLIVGLVMGALWVWHKGEPLWEHALKLLVLLFVVAPLVLGRMRRKHPPVPGQLTLAYPRLVVAKLVLLVVTLAASALLRDKVDNADLVVAVGMAVVIAVGGPLIHPRLLVRAE